ncbi:MAG: barstar family protein [Longimicrobiales bacterium]
MSRSIPSVEQVREVVETLQGECFDAVWVDRAPVFDKTSLMHALYQSLQLTADFGFNWDALEDALFGSEDPATPPRILVFRDLELLEERDAEAAEVFLDIVATVAADAQSTLHGLVRAGA